MFDKLNILENEYIIYNTLNNKEKYINLIESFLLENQNILTIYKNKNDSYSIYKNKDIEDNFIIDPIITFNENSDFELIYSFLKELINLEKTISSTILNYENKIKERNKQSKNNINFLEKKLFNLNKLIYSDPKEKTIINNIISKIIDDNNYECADNFRYARIGDKFQEHIYQEIQDSGCCGFYDKEIDVDGIKYKIGFNYGH